MPLDEFGMHAFDQEIWEAMFPRLIRGDGELGVGNSICP
jgi:hypothetical protein